MNFEGPLPRPFVFYIDVVLTTLYLGGFIHFAHTGQTAIALKALGLASIFALLAWLYRN